MVIGKVAGREADAGRWMGRGVSGFAGHLPPLVVVHSCAHNCTLAWLLFCLVIVIDFVSCMEVQKVALSDN